MTKFYTLAAMFIVALTSTSTIAAEPSKQTYDRQMLRLDPATRLEQRCDARAMGEVSRAHKGMQPDELIAYAYASPKTQGHTISASGAAVRSKGVWYHLTYACVTTPDGLEILSFRHTLGAPIARGEWAEHYLVAP